MALLPVDESALNKLGAALLSKFELRKTARKPLEDKWLQNLRQYRGIYDPEVVLPKGASKAYPKLTRWKVVATTARLMAMLFPQQEKNYEIQASKIANLPVATVQQIIDTLAQQSQGQPLNDEMIQKAVQTEAETRAAGMGLKIDDDLQEINYPSEVRRVVASATNYGPGLLKGPTTKVVTETAWKQDGTGRYLAYERETYKPVLEFKSVWSYYPDLSATDVWHQEGIMERDVYTREEIRALREDKGFMKNRIDYWLSQNPSGNHKLLEWEQAIWQDKKSDRSQVNQSETTKCVMITYTGDISGLEAAGAGLLDETADTEQSYKVIIAALDSVIVKAALIPKEMVKVRLHHTFVFEEDDLSMMGNGLTDTLRDSQFSLCETVRAMLDEVSMLGTDLAIDMEMLEDGETMDRYKNRTWRVRSDGSPAQSAKQPIVGVHMQNNLNSYLQVIQVFLDFADKESSLPPASMGDVSGGGSEALRTKGNASMFLGAASLPIRDTVRNFDNFTVSVISAMAAWNTKYAPDPARDGDADVVARGSTSLIAKEVLADSLDQLRATVTEDEIDDIDARALFRERMLARDIPVDKVLVSTEVAAQRRAAKQQQAQKQQDLAASEIEAKVKKLLADAFKAVKDGQATDSNVSLDTFNALIKALETNAPEPGKPATASA